ncbi:zinc finger protein-domain-containing protein [Lasiosphaeria ovina]|uniref:Zinc finger protein-domain-containing protein n=1 Tax=Lasiosphaeria ovina TaxID=92902 RepID=A0AAE0JW64_9PEZI|nr:zinc finger protein-domain-containing protein [Lasiosphaeria ovina]
MSPLNQQDHRRRLFTSSESIAHPTSPKLDDDLAANLQLLDILDRSTSQEDVTPSTSDSPDDPKGANNDLKRMLSLHSQVSTTSSTAQQHAKAQAEGLQIFRKIGAGACGAVFAEDGKLLVYKLAKSDDGTELWNDYVMHSKICKHFQRFIIDEVRVPECYYFVPNSRTTYFDNSQALVKAAEDVCNVPTSVLVTERVLPLPAVTRSLLIDKYCTPRNKDMAHAAIANKDCLVRVYLGSMQGKTGGMFFSLRNFKLHLNHMLELTLNVEAMAHRMGISLAVMHWAAKTDARDVEFVLGSSTKKTPAVPSDVLDTMKPLTYTGPPSDRNEDFFRRITELWILDFNQVRRITMDDEGVNLAVEAWRLNDPYYPKPLRETSAERHLWNAFVISYLTASQGILEDENAGKEVMELPRKFILGITEVERAKASYSYHGIPVN